MKAIGHLRGVRRATTDGIGIRPVAIAADDHNPGMRGEPGRHRLGGAHPEDIDDPAAGQVDENRPVVMVPLPPGPVIEANDLEDARRGRFHNKPLQQAENSVVADGHAQAGEQSLAAQPTQRMPDEMHHGAKSLRVVDPRRRDAG
jgi:hypothetical protein